MLVLICNGGLRIVCQNWLDSEWQVVATMSLKFKEINMNIAKCKIDKRGRMTLPLSFLKANGIQPEDCEAVIQPIQNNLNTVKVVFTLKGNRNCK